MAVSHPDVSHLDTSDTGVYPDISHQSFRNTGAKCPGPNMPMREMSDTRQPSPKCPGTNRPCPKHSGANRQGPKLLRCRTSVQSETDLMRVWMVFTD